ncbi:putative beta-glucuronidase [Paramyrothecium foliicola]|nr:putative beta-glucuronidase [Paramyrothecium foliicola]
MHLPHLSTLAGLVSFFWASNPVRAQPTPYEVKTPPLDTDWTYEVGTNPWPEHPRPQLRREAWKSLNGIWTFQRATSNDDIANPPSGALEREVLVPSCVESGLSGIQELDVTHMWFATTFDVPQDWQGQSVILNFEAVDYEATVFVNGEQVHKNTGGYFRFSIDVSENVNFNGTNNLLVFVRDPTDAELIPVGKQVRRPSHIFYRSCSGIWQQVWLERAPSDHITQLDVAAASNGTVTATVHSSGKNEAPVEISIVGQDGTVIASHTGTADSKLEFVVESPDLWSPSSPTLYNLTVTLGDDDEVSSYTGFRTISIGEVDGVVRPLLNGEFVFQFGTLDQGYWPDGLHTPPNREAMIYDLKLLKDLGFNMVRKHIKVEPDLFYQACDQLGLLVFQDMPSLPSDTNNRPPNAQQRQEFRRQFEILVNEHKSYPSIVTWVIFNEAWGQVRSPPWPEEELTALVRSIDPSRLVNSVSGWNDHGFGDFSDNHHYANPQCGTPFYSRASSPYDPKRIGFQGEFGGIGQNISIENLWNVKQAIDAIDQTYELNADLESYNYRASVLFREFREQIERYACSGGVWTQTTDVEGEVNGLLTYDRRLLRPDADQWKADIQSLYEAAASRGGAKPNTD